VAIVTSVEHDHIDIYPTKDSYEAAFTAFAHAMPKGGLVVCAGHDVRARSIMSAGSARVSYYGLEGDDFGRGEPHWLAAPCPPTEGGVQPFDLYAGGVACGRFALGLPGRHNVRNATAAIAACAEGFGVPVASARTALASFHGVRRRQDLLGTPGGVFVYDDFAHHPTAVDETLRALRARHSKGVLWAVFEPRSATACRALHQEAYAHAFGAADHVLLAPLGRRDIPDAERLDLARLARDLGPKAIAAPSLDVIVERVTSGARPGDVVALLSNGAFGGLTERLLTELGKRPASQRD